MVIRGYTYMGIYIPSFADESLHNFHNASFTSAVMIIRFRFFAVCASSLES